MNSKKTNTLCKWDTPTLDRILYLIINMDGEDSIWDCMEKGGSETVYLVRDDVLRLLKKMRQRKKVLND
jgi:hypothetical protein